MIRNFSLGDLVPGFYVPGDSLLHRISVARRLSLALLTLVIAAFAEWTGIAGAGILCLTGLLFSRMGFGMVLRRLKYYVWFILLIAIFPAFFTPGPPLDGGDGFSLGLTSEGLEAAALTACRLILMFLVSMIFIHTTKPTDLFPRRTQKDSQLAGVGNFLNEAGTVGLMALQILPLLCIEVEQWLAAEFQSRKKEIRGSLFNKARQTARLLVPLTVSIFENPEKFSQQLKKADREFQTGECKPEEKS